MAPVPAGTGAVTLSAGGICRLAARSLALLGVLWMSGCYTAVPMFGMSSVRPGQDVIIEMNDAGRVAVADRLGPELYQVEGQVVRATPDDLTLKVGAISNVGGSRNIWNGEQVTFQTNQVRSVSEKRLSKSRTGLLAAIGLAAVVVLIVEANLFGFGSDKGLPGGGGGDPPDS